jgi:hypothetical protein
LSELECQFIICTTMTTKARSTAKAASTPKASVSHKKNGGSKTLMEVASNDGEAIGQPLSRDRIAARAYLIWKERGCPEGCEEENWRQAEQELTTQTFTR